MTIERFLAYEPKLGGARGRSGLILKRLHTTLHSLEIAISIAPSGEGKDLMEEAHNCLCASMDEYGEEPKNE